jgi:hypothetical protein
METTTSLVDYIKDKFVPEPKSIPERIKKDITLDLEDPFCPLCGQILEYFYTGNPRLLVTIEFDINLSAVHKKCVNPGCIAYASGRNFHNPDLELYVLPKKTFALDVILLIGHLIQQESYTEHEVVDYLLHEHGIPISQSSVNGYKRIALALGETLIIGNPDKIKEGLDKNPCRIYSVDGLSSNKSRTLFVIRDVFSGTVLGSVMLDKHDSETFCEFFKNVFQMFGEPDYLIGDGERGLMGAAREHFSHIPYQYCQRHFLDNMGTALMEDLYKALKKS